MKIAIGSDRNAVPLKREIIEELEAGGHEPTDFGSEDPIYDYVAGHNKANPIGKREGRR